jgi:activating signal cointegrator complex subunit 3
LNAEVVAGTIATRSDAVGYLTWTFFFRRLLGNPSYYDLDGTEADDINAFLSDLVQDTLLTLEVRTFTAT